MIKIMHALAASFRQSIVEAVSDRRLTIAPFSRFPHDCCDMTSELLAKYLFDNHIVTWMIIGTSEKYDRNHVWLRTNDGITIDITADQFNAIRGMPNNNPPVIVGEELAIHYVFQIKEAVKDHYVWNIQFI